MIWITNFFLLNLKFWFYAERPHQCWNGSVGIGQDNLTVETIWFWWYHMPGLSQIQFKLYPLPSIFLYDGALKSPQEWYERKFLPILFYISPHFNVNYPCTQKLTPQRCLLVAIYILIMNPKLSFTNTLSFEDGDKSVNIQ